MTFEVHDTQFIRYSFRRQLQAAIDEGSLVESESGLDYLTMKAVDAVAHSYPNVDPKLVSKAKAELESQLDGTHDAAMSAMPRLKNLPTRPRKSRR